MLPYNHTEFISILTGLVKDNVITMSRINDAVSRILRVKFMMGLFENPFSDESFVSQLGSQVRLLILESPAILNPGRKNIPPKLI